MKRKLIFIIPLIAIILAAIIYPWMRMLSEDKIKSQQEENLVIATSFTNYYGSQAKISNITEPKLIRAVYWTDDTYMHASLYIDGIWFEYAREELIQPTPIPGTGP